MYLDGTSRLLPEDDVTKAWLAKRTSFLHGRLDTKQRDQLIQQMVSLLKRLTINDPKYKVVFEEVDEKKRNDENKTPTPIPQKTPTPIPRKTPTPIPPPFPGASEDFSLNRAPMDIIEDTDAIFDARAMHSMSSLPNDLQF